MRNHLSRKLFAGMLSCLLLILTACGGDNGSTKSATPTPAGDPNQLITYTLGIPPEAFSAPQVGNVPDNTPMHVDVTFKTNDQTLNQLSGDGQTAQNGKAQDVESYANQLGISDATYQKIKSFFGVQGATLTLGNLHTDLAIDAPASTFASLLHTSFVYHQGKDRKYFTPTSATLKLPRIVVDNLEAVTGLDSYSPPLHNGFSSGAQLHPLTLQSNTAADNNCPQAGMTWSDGSQVVTAQQVAHAYGLDQAWKKGWTGKGTTIILNEFDGFNNDDVQQYFNCVGFKGSLKVINVGPAPAVAQSPEPTLDIEMIAGLAPDANIVVYQTDQTQTSGDPFLPQLDQIAKDYAKNNSPVAISISWGLSELETTSEDIKAEASRFQVLYKTEHITTFAASGDCAAFDDQEYGKLSVNTPASIPTVVGVGGTVLDTDNTGNRTSEVVWESNQNKSECDNNWGSGGGVSTFYKLPSWQTSKITGVKSKYSNGNRQVPDLSAVAWGVPIYFEGQWEFSGGTSAATPIWATSFAVLNQSLISQTGGYYVFGPSVFYVTAQNSGKSHPYFDVQKGDNLHYPATAGYDMASGLGVPNLTDLQKVLVQLIKSSKKK